MTGYQEERLELSPETDDADNVLFASSLWGRFRSKSETVPVFHHYSARVRGSYILAVEHDKGILREWWGVEAFSVEAA
jgi:hypothetical protein